ncbi:WYL domain-containing protein [Lachnospiraceae bacterium KH1T2]|nr:WYL domain-containing protein [Lachnospiraceae bacterium KH1T2]
MYTKQTKKMLPLIVLEVLRRYTDENHRLSQKDIEKYLSEKYDMVVDRRSIRRSLTDLMDMGIDIQYSEITRKVKDSMGVDEEQSILTDFYIEREFSNCEIRLLIDELMHSKYVPTRQRRQLIEKLEGLSNIYFRKSLTQAIDVEIVENQLFYTIEVIDNAIFTNSKVKFLYRNYQIGKGNRVGFEDSEYYVTPYEMRVVDGDYLLICDDGTDELSLRMDYISEIRIVNNNGKGVKRRASHNYEKTIMFAISESMISLLVEQFGSNKIRIEGKDDDVTVCISANEKSAVDFAVKYSDMVTIISPESSRKKVMDRLRKGLDRYMVAS